LVSSACHSPAPAILQQLPFSSNCHSPATTILQRLPFSSDYHSPAPAILQPNTQFVVNARKPKSKKRLITTARWLTAKDAQELREKQNAKEDAEIAKKEAAIKKKAETEARKAQKASDRTVRLLGQQSTKEFEDEYLRLAKIHKNYYK
jgi:hypothetical protein